MPILVIALINQEVCSSTQPLQFKPSRPFFVSDSYCFGIKLHRYSATFKHMPQTMHIPVTCLDPHYTSYNLIADKHQFLSGVQTLHAFLSGLQYLQLWTFTLLHVDAL